MISVMTCANCGKGEESACDLKFCNACKLVKYCNRDCQIAHRPQHKKACKKRVAEFYNEELFKDPPPREECPICMLPLPLDPRDSLFQSCCGKTICEGCFVSMMKEEIRRGRKKIEEYMCAICRTHHPGKSEEDQVKQYKNLMEKDNAMGYYQFGGDYARGTMGMQQDCG